MICSDDNVFYYGKPDMLPEKYYLKAGQVEAVYENGSLRYISFLGRELLRNIYSAVRDRNWGTIHPSVSNERINVGEKTFSVSYKAHYKNSEIDFVAEYEIVGLADNTITFSMKGKAVNGFLKNRIGFCVLHPLEGVKGKPCTIYHPDSTVTNMHFPSDIRPHQPATNILSIDWDHEIGMCHLSFEGDVWEMEDHRNWTDSSFKTYCTPLSIPFPALTEEGSEINQKVTFNVDIQAPVINFKGGYQLSPESREYILPEIGTSINAKVLTEAEYRTLKKAGLKHLRYDVKFGRPSWQKMLEVAAENSRLLGIPVELVLHFTGNAKNEIAALGKLLPNPSEFIKFVWFVNDKLRLTDDKLIDEVFGLLKQIFPLIPLGGGTDAYFAEFNRNRFDASPFDFVTYAVCPQVHAFDNDSLVENMAAQSDTVESAKRLYPGKEIRISPITLKQRFNVVATGDEPPVPDNLLPTQVDERQMSLFAAGWTLGSLASLIRAGAKSCTFYEAAGWRGIIQGDDENLKPLMFAGKRGDIYPVFHLFRFLHSFNPEKVQLCKSSHPLKFTGVILEKGLQKILLLANHRCESLKICLEGMEADRFLELSKDNMPEALKNEDFTEVPTWRDLIKDFVVVKPYSLLFIKLK